MKNLTETLLFNLNNSNYNNTCYENVCYESVSDDEINEDYIVEGDPLESAKNWLDTYVPAARKKYMGNITAQGKNIYIEKDLCLKVNTPPFPTDAFKIVSIGGKLELRNCKWTDLTSIPEKIGHDLYIYDFKKLVNLKGCPNVLNGNLFIYGCPKLTSLNGSPKKVSSVIINNCQSLTSLKDISQNIKTNLIVIQCGIRDLSDINTSCQNISISDCNDFKSLDGLGDVKGIKTLQLKNNAHINGSIQFD